MTIGTPQSLGTNTGSASPLAITTLANILVGDLVVVGITYQPSTNAVSAVTDGTNTYALAVRKTNGGTSELWYKANCKPVASGASLSVTTSGSLSDFIIGAARVTGVDTSAAALDKTNSANGASVATGVLTNAVEIIFGVFGGYNETAVTESAGFSNIISLQQAADQVWLNIGYKITAATGSVTYAVTPTGAAANSESLVATFNQFIAVVGPQLVDQTRNQFTTNYQRPLPEVDMQRMIAPSPVPPAMAWNTHDTLQTKVRYPGPKNFDLIFTPGQLPRIVAGLLAIMRWPRGGR